MEALNARDSAYDNGNTSVATLDVLGDGDVAKNVCSAPRYFSLSGNHM